MPHEVEAGSRFVVDLGTVKLSPLVEKQVEAEIQAVVLRALAESGGGGQRAEQDRIARSIWDTFPGQTLGLWPGYPDKPPDIFDPGGGGPLVVPDHTIIMKAIMEHPLEVIRYLPQQYKTKSGPRPTGKEVLQAALQVNQIDNHAKARIRAALDVLPQIEEGQAALPQSAKQAVEELRQQLTHKTTVEAKRSVLREAGQRHRHRGDGLADGMEVAAQILEDGKASIYSPDHSFYKLLQARRGSSSATARDANFGDLADTDGVGAVAGGGVGTIVPGVGTTLGGVAGGVGASAGFAIAWAIDSILDLF